MKIVTYHDYPPIPVRDFDWSAYDYDTYSGEPTDPIGRGKTEKEAIDDLMAQLEEIDE